ncbi:MAG TPA: hypothetical protein VLD62_10445, partial [Acidimicrobiia bacterium]|nr:hypothetical protein [Acidimicrobiia bacterium]
MGWLWLLLGLVAGLALGVAIGILVERRRRAVAPGAGPAPALVPASDDAGLAEAVWALRTAERRLAAADQRLLVAKRSLYPRFSLTASGGTVSDSLGD